MKSARTPYDKYSALRSTDLDFSGKKPEQKTLLDSFYELFDDWTLPAPTVATPKKLRLREEKRVSQLLLNLYGWTWVGEIWMGGNKSLDVVFDTGSDWLVMESIDCNSCQGDRYNIK